MDFKLLGLNKYESNAYEALIRLGKTTASKLSSESRVPYSRIYDVLESLINKELVKVVPEKTKMFISTDPDSLSRMLQEKKKQLELMEKELQSLKAQYEFHEKEPVIVSKGKINFWKLIKSLPKPKTFSYKIKYASDFKPENVRREKECLKRGIPIKVLARYDAETKSNVQKWLKINRNFKRFDNGGVAIDISDETVLISLIPPNPNAIIQINNKNFADIMKRLFEAAYENVDVIKKE